MATTNTFVIEYGLSVGSTEVINSSGKIWKDIRICSRKERLISFTIKKA